MYKKYFYFNLLLMTFHAKLVYFDMHEKNQLLYIICISPVIFLYS